MDMKSSFGSSDSAAVMSNFIGLAASLLICLATALPGLIAAGTLLPVLGVRRTRSPVPAITRYRSSMAA